LPGSGYEVAWNLGGGLYSIWNVNNSGNYIGPLLGATPGNSAALEAFEFSFHQDLNADGVVGAPTPQILGSPSTPAPGDQFVFRPGFGTDVISQFPTAAKIELDGFSTITSDTQLANLLHDAQSGQPQAVFQQWSEGHDTLIDLGNHDVIMLLNVTLASLHASDFIIR
jgi:hypothetical protein